MAPDPTARALGPFIAYDAGVAVEHPGIGGDSGRDPSNKFIRVGLGGEDGDEAIAPEATT